MAFLEDLNCNKIFIYLSSTNIELKWLASVSWRINFFAICQSQNIMASNFGSGFRKSRSVSGGHNFNVDSHFGLIKIIFSIDEKTKKNSWKRSVENDADKTGNCSSTEHSGIEIKKQFCSLWFI